MTNNDLPCNKCGGQHHPVECLKEELKPCPFCGGEAKLDKDPSPPIGVYPYYVYSRHLGKCLLSFCDIPYYRTKEYAIKAWNTREGDKG